MSADDVKSAEQYLAEIDGQIEHTVDHVCDLVFSLVPHTVARQLVDRVRGELTEALAHIRSDADAIAELVRDPGDGDRS